jgi:hypothetical protein
MNGTVYVDFDDVLSETARLLADIVAARFGRRTPFEKIYSFDLGISFGLAGHEQDILIELFHDADMLASIPPVAGAAEGMRTWADKGCEVHVVTGRPPETEAASRAWLAMHQIPYADITFVDKYGRGHRQLPGVRQLKLEELDTVDFALIVDDSPAMAKRFSMRGDIPVAVFDRPWNADLGPAGSRPNVVRCRDWNDLLTRFPQPGGKYQ